MSAASDRAELALRNSRAMCDLLAQCRQYKVAGWWDGSAYRSHPVGLIVDTIKFTNHWHVDQYCDITLTDGSGWDRNVCKDSFAHSSPHPKAIGGSEVSVWRCGAWHSAELEGALRARVLEILTAAAEHIEREERAQVAAEEVKVSEARAAREAITAAAVARVAGAPA